MTKPSIDKATPRPTAPERIWLGKPLDDKSWEWHGAWSPKPFSENVNSVEYVREDIADERVRALREALEKIRDECHPRDLKDVEGLCSGCVAERALEEVK